MPGRRETSPKPGRRGTEPRGAGGEASLLSCLFSVLRDSAAWICEGVTPRPGAGGERRVAEELPLLPASRPLSGVVFELWALPGSCLLLSELSCILWDPLGILTGSSSQERFPLSCLGVGSLSLSEQASSGGGPLSESLASSVPELELLLLPEEEEPVLEAGLLRSEGDLTFLRLHFCGFAHSPGGGSVVTSFLA